MRHLSPLQTKGMRLRIRLLAGVLAVGCLGGLVGRLAVLQLVDADGYAARASDQQLRGATLPAARGEITSADGTLLAASETCWTIRAAPRELADELVEPAAKALSGILELDYAETLEKFSVRTSTTACCAAAPTGRWPTPCVPGVRSTMPRASRSGRIPAASTRRGFYGRPAGALPM